ncbi:hypothetical protein ACHAWU_009169 [Discostella pseudostelligera]|uniref:BTB domain-containing protein n=1 Tax=Discostella pseudostelligera TaxID=259834 RepID=A0ABD3N2A2_9STRA
MNHDTPAASSGSSSIYSDIIIAGSSACGINSSAYQPRADRSERNHTMSLPNTNTADKSTNNDNSVASIHVGTPPPNFQAWTTNTVYFHGFADLIKEGKTFVRTVNAVQRQKSADVVFEIGGKLIQRDNESRQEATRTETKFFYAHSLILKKVAPLLADFCKSTDPNTTVQISNMLPGTFWVLLCYIYGGTTYIYGGTTPCFESSESIKDVIKAADRFGVINLKLEVEVHYVSSLTLTLDNVMENLHFADSNNCALLKESVMDYIIKNKVEMLEKKVLSDAIIEGLGSDILAAIIRGEKKDGVAESHEDNFNAMSVNELRRRAFWSRLDVDGSREMLIAALDKKKSDLRSLESNKQK